MRLVAAMKSRKNDVDGGWDPPVAARALPEPIHRALWGQRELRAAWSRVDSERSPSELARAHGLWLPESVQGSVKKRQREFVAGRLCARSAMHQWGVDADVGREEETRLPRFPPELWGSISHTDDLAVAVVGRGQQWLGLGVDVERVVDDEAGDRLARRVVTAKDGSWTRRAGFGPGTAFSLVFSGKESAFKALFPRFRVYLGFEDMELQELHRESGPDGLEHGAFELQLRKRLCRHFLPGTFFSGSFVRIQGWVLTAVSVGADRNCACAPTVESHRVGLGR